MIEFTFEPFQQPSLHIDAPIESIPEGIWPSESEVILGLRKAWISQEDAVHLGLRKLKAGKPLTHREEAVALLLSDELDKVDASFEDVHITEKERHEASRIWLFMFLRTLHDHRDHYKDPWRMIEMIYTEFEYPEAMLGFVGFMPAQGRRAAGGYEGMLRNWEAYLSEEEHRLRA